MRRNRIQIICPTCKKTHEKCPSQIKLGRKYCSRKCYLKSHMTGKYKNCPICNKIFWNYRGHKTCSKLCSYEWRKLPQNYARIRENISKSKKGRSFVRAISVRTQASCCNCNIKFLVLKTRVNLRKELNQNIFCSRKCQGEYRSKHYRLSGSANWRGGKSRLQVGIRGLPENTQWIDTCLKRDEYTCQECGQIGRKLEVHHKIRMSELIKEFLSIYNQFSPIEDYETLIRLAITHKPFWDIDNGETKCIKCHRLVNANNKVN